MDLRKNKTQRATTFSELYVDYFNRCCFYAQSYLHDPYLSEDVASDAMMKLWENWDDSFSPVQRKAFLLTTVRNRCLDHLRKMQTIIEKQEDINDTTIRELNFRISMLESTDPQELFVADIQKIVDETLSQLSEQTQLIFRLSRTENKTAAEISADLGIGIKAVEYHITKSLSALRRKLKDYLPIVFFLY